VRSGGLESYSNDILDRWFCEPLRHDAVRLAPWRNMLIRTPVDGYLGTSAAIAGSDMTESTRQLNMPVLALVGENDGATLPDLVEGTAKLCRAEFHIIKDAGHLPCVEQPRQTATLINSFLDKTA